MQTSIKRVLQFVEKYAWIFWWYNHLFISYWWTDLQALASTLDPEEIHDLRDQFDAMDVDRNGTITLEEIRHVCYWLQDYYTLPSFDDCMRWLSGWVYFELAFTVHLVLWWMDQALQKDRPWSVKESRVLEILQAVRDWLRVVSVHSKHSGIF